MTATPRPAGGGGALDGFRIGVTSDRRSTDLITALERRGGEVLHAPALTMTHNPGEDELLADTRRVIQRKPAVVLITTGYGMQRWLEVADAAGLGAELIETLEDARILARGPKAHGAVRAAGLLDIETAGLESTTDLVDAVEASGLTDRAVVIQLHGFTDDDQLARLTGLSAELLTVTPYRWMPPSSSDRLPRLIRAACEGQLDAITFTSAPAAVATLERATSIGLYREFTRAMAEEMAVVAVGPITAQPLREAGAEVLIPERYRLGALIRLVTEQLAERQVQRFRGPRSVPAGARLLIEIRGSRVVVGDRSVRLGRTARNLLTTLSRSDGVVTRQALTAQLPDSSDEHALEVAISRLRRTVGVPELIKTVTKRGYQFDAEPLAPVGSRSGCAD